MQIWPEGNLCLNNRNEAQPLNVKRGDIEAGFRAADHVFEDRYTTAFDHNAQMEPRSAVAVWEGDKLTVYTPTGGIANCRHDIARDLGIPDEKVRVVCQYMGGNFGNKNQNQDADLIAVDAGEGSARAGEAGDVAQGRLHRRARSMADDPVLQGGRQERRHAHGDPAARVQRHGPVSKELRIDGRHRAVCMSQRREGDPSGVHEPDRLREFPGTGVSAGVSSAFNR